jgi:hypothetical protein
MCSVQKCLPRDPGTDSTNALLSIVLSLIHQYMLQCTGCAQLIVSSHLWCQLAAQIPVKNKQNLLAGLTKV